MMAKNKLAVTLRIPKDLNNRLTSEASRLGLSRNSYIQMVLTKSVQKEVI